MKYSIDAVSSAAAVSLVDSVRKNKFESVERILRINPSLIDQESQSFNQRYTPLAMAAKHNRLDMLHLLLQKGARTEVSSSHGTALLEASSLGYLDVIEALLNNAADVTLTERGTGYNALMTACAYGKTAVARQLLSHGAYLSIDQRGRHDGRTALWYAASAGNRDMVKLLLRDGGASTGVKDSHGRTAAELAKDYGHNEVADIISVSTGAHMWKLSTTPFNEFEVCLGQLITWEVFRISRGRTPVVLSLDRMS
jgi:ankyrin repeat protein